MTHSLATSTTRTLWACGHCRSFCLLQDAYVEVNDPESVHRYDSIRCGECDYEGSNYFKFETSVDFDIPDDNKLPLEFNPPMEYL